MLRPMGLRPNTDGGGQKRQLLARITQMCLSLKVTPAIAPPCRGFQADIDAFNRPRKDTACSRFLFRKSDDAVAQANHFEDAH